MTLSILPDVSENPEVGQIRVVLIEDDAGLRERLASAVRHSPSLKLAGDFGSAEEALENIIPLSPHVAVVDLNLPGMDGIACTATLKQMLPSCEALVLTVFDDTQRVLDAIKAGARGYLLKRSSHEDLIRGIHDVWNGGAPMNPVIARKVLESFKPRASAFTATDTESQQTLSKREEEILQLLVEGNIVKELPDILNITEFTVRFHLRQIYKKLHVNNLTHAVVKYLNR